MLDFGASEILLIVIVAIVVIGPKDLPLALRTAGRWLGKVRKVSAHFKAGVETMIREAELEEMEKKWQAQNQQIMAANPKEEMTAENLVPGSAPVTGQSTAESASGQSASGQKAAPDATPGPQLASKPGEKPAPQPAPAPQPPAPAASPDPASAEARHAPAPPASPASAAPRASKPSKAPAGDAPQLPLDGPPPPPTA